MTIQALAGTPRFPQIFVIDGAATGSIVAPRGATRVTVEAIGGGGAGAGTNAGNRAGGGGGRFARTINMPVTGGVTTVFYSVGAAATQSWVNVGTNVAPASTAAGCLAPPGTNAALNTGGNGTTGTAIGTVTANGGDGVGGGPSAGGGAGAGADIAGAGTGGSGTTAGTDTTGMSISTQLMGNGTGGVGTVGTAPGGGGGGTTGGGGAGAIGRVRITFYG